MKRPERTKQRRGSVLWAAADLNIAVVLIWRELVLWDDHSGWAHFTLGLFAVIWLAWFFDEIRAIVRSEITRVQFQREIRLDTAVRRPWHP